MRTEEKHATAHENKTTRSSKGDADKKQNDEEREVLEVEDGSEEEEEEESEESQDHSRNNVVSAHTLFLAQRRQQK